MLGVSALIHVTVVLELIVEMPIPLRLGIRSLRIRFVQYETVVFSILKQMALVVLDQLELLVVAVKSNSDRDHIRTLQHSKTQSTHQSAFSMGGHRYFINIQ